MNQPTSQPCSDRLLAAQFNEISQREQVSSAIAYPAVVTIAWVHWGTVSTVNTFAWVTFMFFVLMLRIVISRKNMDIAEHTGGLRFWFAVRVLVTVVYGLGWGAMLFLLDSGRLDFLFMFKLASLAGVLGVAVNAMNVLLPVYAGFIATLFTLLTFFIFGHAPYMNADEQLSLFLGVLVYCLFLLVAARKGEVLTRNALVQRFDREQAVAQARAAESDLRASQERLRLILDSTSEGIYGADINGVCTFVNQACLSLLGYAREDALVGKVLHPLIHHTYPDGRPYPSESCHVRLATLKGESTHVDNEVHWRADGSSFPVEYRSHPILHDGQVVGTVVSFSDITERKKAEAELRIAAVAFDSQEGMMVTDANTVILHVNHAFSKITGYSSEEAVGKTPNLFKSSRHAPEFYRAMWESIQTTGGWQGEIWDRRKNGEEFPKWLTITAVKGEDGQVTNYIGSHFDITERKKAEEKILELAFYDPLTHLPNRTLLLDRLRQVMTSGSRNGSHGAVLFIDLDHFKTLNDTQGHDMGDQLLREVARRLTAGVRDGDTVARLGGDEFVVVLGNLDPRPREAASQTETVGEKLLAALNQVYLLGGNEHHSSASIGATLFSGQETAIEDVLKQADLSMYKAKEAGRNALRFFDPAMQRAVMERAALEADLRLALQERQFELHFQAQVIDDGRIAGAEALVRWRHPERGLVAPDHFIPLSEDTGLILPLGHWVLEFACACLADWAARPGLAELTLAVNVSARQFHQADFVEQVLAVLEKTRANPRRLKLELTESVLVNNIADVTTKMRALKSIGVGFALDDFGTGYSSLSYLSQLPLDQLKIDRSFVMHIEANDNAAAICAATISLAHSLNLKVVAEGVETEAQRYFLGTVHRCDMMQGYLFSRPIALAEFESRVAVK